jgi:hypothetical protein
VYLTLLIICLHHGISPYVLTSSSLFSGENEQLRVGVRHALKQQQDSQSMVVSNQSTYIGVLATAAHAATEKLRFSVIYHPRYAATVLT